MKETDHLVIGSGIAGLTYAIKIAEQFKNRNVTIITKEAAKESNTQYAQGGIAISRGIKQNTFEQHIEDTLKAGDGLCNLVVVDKVIREGSQRLKELIAWEANFDQDDSGKFILGKEGGHSVNRIIHHKDCTGKELIRVLLKKVKTLANVTILSHHFAIDLITEHQLKKKHYGKKKCFGVYVLDQHNDSVITIKSKTVLLATGGIGQVYKTTTNPSIATADGIAMAYRAKAHIEGMEFIQFHPTIVYDHTTTEKFLISEAVRGFGAYLRNSMGRRFLFDYDVRGELASRDIVSRAIYQELRKSKEKCVYLDITHLDIDSFKKQFPTITAVCIAKGINLELEGIPVVPAAHYLCGGIVVDEFGETTIDNLYACGECANTGLHGANRLASNSLLEALVYADIIYKSHFKIDTKLMLDIPDWETNGTITRMPKEEIIRYKDKLQSILEKHVGIIRSKRGLEIARKKLEELFLEIEVYYKTNTIDSRICELRNMINTAFLIITQSQKRHTNKGGYYNIDIEKNTFKKE